MNKILSGVLGIVLVASVTAGTAYALFTSQATVSGITISAGSASLLINDGDTFVSSWDTGLNLTNVFPGFEDETDIILRNDSSVDIDLAVSAKLTASGPEWPALANEVEVAITNDTGDLTTGFHALAEWNSTGFDLPGDPIGQGENSTYTVQVRIPNTVGNEIAGLTLSDITFTLTGTQVVAP